MELWINAKTSTHEGEGAGALRGSTASSFSGRDLIIKKKEGSDALRSFYLILRKARSH
jgi:hypothetical protein